MGDCYPSYNYDPACVETSIVDKFKMHGGAFSKNADGGSALHLNLSQMPDKETFLWLRNLAAKYECNYWTTNVLTKVCNDCGHVESNNVDACPKCGSHNLDAATRIIGYLTRIKSFSEGRRKEAEKRYYH